LHPAGAWGTLSGRVREELIMFWQAQTFLLSAGLFPASKDIHHAAESFIEQLDREEIDQFPGYDGFKTVIMDIFFKGFNFKQLSQAE
jgi:hypothetical protein